LFAQCSETGTEEQTERRRKEAQGGGEGQKGTRETFFLYEFYFLYDSVRFCVIPLFVYVFAY